MSIKTYKAGEEVVRQGAVGSLFGILVHGELEISAEGPHGPVVLCRRDKGYYFGEVNEQRAQTYGWVDGMEPCPVSARP